MTGRLLLPVLTLVFLAGAVVSGNAVSARTSVDTFHHVEAVGSGLQRLKHFVASALYLQLDDYHHIEMYQGVPWTQVTDYLPQMWLIARLDPHFTDVYTDAAYQLAVNLGDPEQGLRFIGEGVRNNPDSLDIRYEYAYLLWETGEGSPEEIISECISYRDLVRRFRGDEEQPYNEGSAAAIISSAALELPDSLNPYAEFYLQRRVFLRNALMAGLYDPGYLEQAPPFMTAEVTEEAP